MFDKTRYVIEMTLMSSFSELARDTYNVKDTYGNLLGYAKKQRLKFWPKFWFEGTDGTQMGEIRSSKKGYEVYDAPNRASSHHKGKATVAQQKGVLPWDYPIDCLSDCGDSRVHDVFDNAHYWFVSYSLSGRSPHRSRSVLCGLDLSETRVDSGRLRRSAVG